MSDFFGELMESMDQIYNADYYHSGCGPIPYEQPEYWVDFFGKVADKIVSTFQPRTVLDAGCAMGYLVAALRDREVQAFGVDISNYAISMVRDDIKPYCLVGSLTEALPETLPSKYDLVVTIEVLEHLSETDGKNAVANLCRLSDTVIFSSTPDDITEPTHVNVQQREYWSRLFAEQGFYNDLALKPNYITSYAVCYRRQTDIVSQIELYERYIRLTETAQQTQLARASKRPFVSTVYWGRDGQALCETQTITVEGEKGDGTVRLQAQLPEGITDLRFDPIEVPCVVEDLHVYSNAGTLRAEPKNAMKYGWKYVFLDRDPKFQIALEGKQITSLDIRAHVTPLDYPEQEELLGQLFQDKEKAAREQQLLREQMETQQTQHEAAMEGQKETHQIELEEQASKYQEMLRRREEELDERDEKLVEAEKKEEQLLAKQQELQSSLSIGPC